jgi:hypothetical protein
VTFQVSLNRGSTRTITPLPPWDGMICSRDLRHGIPSFPSNAVIDVMEVSRPS